MLSQAPKLFEEIPQRDQAHSNNLLFEYSRNHLNQKVLNLFSEIHRSNGFIDGSTLSCVLKACSCLSNQNFGKQVHCYCIKTRHEVNVSVGTSLIDMYMKTNGVYDGKRVFDEMPERNVVSWTSLLTGYTQNGLSNHAWELFVQMQMEGIKPNYFTFATVLAASSGNMVEKGLQIYCQVIKLGFETNTFVCNSLVNMFSKSGLVEYARIMFESMENRNAVSWNGMIAGFVQNGHDLEALELFYRMRIAGIELTQMIFATVIKLCSNLKQLSFARQLHCRVLKSAFDSDCNIRTALMVAYNKCCEMDDAYSLFTTLYGFRNVVSWTAMITGYLQNGGKEQAASLFCQMSREGGGIKPNEFTFSSVINACAAPMAAVEQGKQCHGISIKAGYHNALCVSSALVTMYAKRGSAESAHEVFKRQRDRDLISWNSMITCFAQHGYGKKALEIFKEMQALEMKMDGITFIGVICACTHAGLVEEGRSYFDSMVKDYQIKPTMEHYACMVDLYSRAGKLKEAMDLINEMPFPAGATVWRTLLGACRVHLNVELGKLAGEKLISLEPQDSSAYVLLSNIYSAAGKWDERAKVRKLMDARNVKKEAGYSWIEVKSKTHSFKACDRSHPLTDRIYAKIEELRGKLKDCGHHPDTSFVLHDIEEDRKEAILFQHSERLAIAFGLIVTPPGTPLQIVKNLRVCGDCHTVIKLLSLLEKRDIVVRDSNRFHHFKNGSCSCGDYW
ncbi:hypothetical protein AQUCO_07200173v1 [Aquilegia coerulea]|uniref:DYW domain-containing protein n=1 Tax=Aquilegia coerulea TaxID=218851 RepID=A0A2G5CAN6_AQUCA|nr:hypothetical protein AQUCO_07200173v1 [Aquilegia coerulea]